MATTKAYELARLLADGFVGSSEIGSDQVLSGNLADNAVTTAKIANSAVTADKINIASSDVPYDNTVSGLSANTIKEAIDALNAISGGGNAGAQATFSRQKFTATADQTAFTVTDGYDVGYLLVFMNGVLLDQTDFTASDGAGFTLSVGAKAGDEIVAIKLDSFAIAELLRVTSISASAPDDSITVTSSGGVEFNNYLRVTGNDAHIILADETGNPADQALRIRHEPIDLNLPDGAVNALIIEDNSPNNAAASIVVEDGVWSRNTPVAWVSFDGDNGSIYHSFGVSSVVREGAGRYKITLSNAMSSADYPIFVTQGGASDIWNSRIATGATFDNRISVRTATTSGVEADAPIVYVAAFGDRA